MVVAEKTASLIEPQAKTKKKAKKIPDSLIYEVIDGKPYYRKGYQEVLSKKKNIDEIMGSSSLQAIIIGLISRFLFKNMPENYIIGGAEMGIHLETNSNFAMDIPIYEISQLSVLNARYASVPPKILIEVDIAAEAEQFKNDFDYYVIKTQKLLDAGVEKIIWIFTNVRKVVLAEPNKAWQTMNWDAAIEVIPSVMLSVQDLLDKSGFTIEP